MKKLLLASAVFFGLLVTVNGYSQDASKAAQDANAAPAQGAAYYQDNANNNNYGREQARDVNYDYSGDYAEGAGCPADHPCEDQKCNDCWCKFCHYEPCYYTEKHCVIDQIPCKKRCCRMVPKYYEVERCRYVPEKYCETICRYEPEYYCVDECKPCKRWVCEKKCRYVPRYYWKHVCGDNSCNSPCPR